MSSTLSSWKQLLKAKQGFELLNEVVVGPQGGTSISLREAVIVTEGMACTVTALDKDKVVINAEVCCPPIEETNVMGEQDINRSVLREDYGRVIWNTNSPTTSRLSWGPEGSPRTNLVVGSGVEGKQHELFFNPLILNQKYEFIVGGCRSFCGDCFSSVIYAFNVRVLTEVAIIASFNLQVLTSLLLSTSTTILLDRFGSSSSFGGEAGASRSIGLAHTISGITLAASTMSILNSTSWGVVPAITTVP